MTEYKIILATNNPGKVKEFEAILAQFNFRVEPQSKYGVPQADETGQSFIENAIIKARNASLHTGLPSIADDSGIEVDALDGAPGIFSARYSADIHGSGANDETNNEKLLKELGDRPASERTARFVCAVAFIRSAKDASPMIGLGTWEGFITREGRGSNGFGYDPIFFVPEFDCTSSELASKTKNSISHRARALSGLVEQLKSARLISAA